MWLAYSCHQKFNNWLPVFYLYFDPPSTETLSLSKRRSEEACVYFWAVSWENRIFANAKTQVHISCAVTAQLISIFAFTTEIIHFHLYLYPKLQDSSFLLWVYRPVCVGPGRKPEDQFSHWLIWARRNLPFCKRCRSSDCCPTGWLVLFLYIHSMCKGLIFKIWNYCKPSLN